MPFYPKLNNTKISTHTYTQSHTAFPTHTKTDRQAISAFPMHELKNNLIKNLWAHRCRCFLVVVLVVVVVVVLANRQTKQQTVAAPTHSNICHTLTHTSTGNGLLALSPFPLFNSGYPPRFYLPFPCPYVLRFLLFPSSTLHLLLCWLWLICFEFASLCLDFCLLITKALISFLQSVLLEF